MKSKNILEMVREILQRFPQSQDSDNDLLARIWYREFLSFGVDRETATRFCKLLAEGKLSHPQSISRTRQKIQEENPSLRGDTYNERQKKSNKIRKEYHK